MRTGEIDVEIADVKLDPDQTPSEIEVIRRAVAAGGPAFFPRHRWFGDKARAVTETALVSVRYTEPHGDAPDPLALTVVEVRFADGGRERYFVPLATTPNGTVAPLTLARLNCAGGQTYVLDDAVGHPAFHQWLLDPAIRPREGGGTGQIVWRPGPGYAAARSGLAAVTARVSGAEQSNSAVIFGTELLAKVFRKLRPGLNPDIEISRFLSAQSDFRSFPELLGDLAFETDDGLTYSIGMTLPFIPNYGDAWAYTLSVFRDMLRGDTGTDLVAPFHLLGVRTGELHRALATSTEDSAFASEPVSAADVDGWTASLEQSIEQTIAALRDRSDRLPLDWRGRLSSLSITTPSIANRIQGFRHLEGADKIRVHGDYHLGQVLVTLDDDFVILDFEGEPSRPMDERRAKTSPLKDVAGMLRSFSYARFAALRAKPDDVPAHEATARLADWEQQARSAFLTGYRSVTADRGATFLPATDAGFQAALAAWELDKAIYEVNYEINNRPDWLPLPLEALLSAEG